MFLVGQIFGNVMVYSMVCVDSHHCKISRLILISHPYHCPNLILYHLEYGLSKFNMKMEQQFGCLMHGKGTLRIENIYRPTLSQVG